MKTPVRNFKLNLLAGTALLAMVAFAATGAATVHKRGTDILHYFNRTIMTNAGVESNAVARVDIRQNRQGNADNQKLDITVKGLTTNTTYSLYALLDGNSDMTAVGNFTTDRKGRAVVHFWDLGNGKALGRGKLPLPAEFDPLSLVRALAIFNSSTQAVFTADLTSPDKLQYLIKRDLSTNAVEASLRIKATQKGTQFRLLASGLNPTNDYWLVLNGGIVQTNSTDAKGRLAIKSLLNNPVEILDVRSLALWDSASNSVLSTTLP